MEEDIFKKLERIKAERDDVSSPSRPNVKYTVPGVVLKLVELRKGKRISQAKMAGKIGISTAALSRNETGLSKMEVGVLVRYAAELGYEIRLILK